jgi:hypothetical protein
MRLAQPAKMEIFEAFSSLIFRGLALELNKKISFKLLIIIILQINYEKNTSSVFIIEVINRKKNLFCYVT